jgi:hypothetical protein
MNKYTLSDGETYSWEEISDMVSQYEGHVQDEQESLDHYKELRQEFRMLDHSRISGDAWRVLEINEEMPKCTT